MPVIYTPTNEKYQEKGKTPGLSSSPSPSPYSFVVYLTVVSKREFSSRIFIKELVNEAKVNLASMENYFVLVWYKL